MYLSKHHGLGNDFLITFVDDVPPNAHELAVALCDRRTGIGADGLIFGSDNGAIPFMQLVNSDGGLAEVSGNGIRCFAHAVAMRRRTPQLDIDIKTPAGALRCVVEPTEDSAAVESSVELGRVTVGDQPDDRGFLDAIEGLGSVDNWATAAVGNPHVVAEVADPAAIDLALVGPQIERHFPNGVNVSFVTVVGKDRIELRVWERGAGITLACGSGATVAAQRMFEWGQVGERVVVEMPGGTAIVDVSTAGRHGAVLSGRVTFVATIEVPYG